MTLLITEEDCRNLLSVKASIPVIEDMFRMAGAGDAENPPRLRMPTRKGKGIQFGPAALHARKLMGFKIRTDVGTPLKPRWDFLYSMETGELLAIIQAALLSRLRTAAASAVAVKYLSPSSASVLGMYGAGRQAQAQLDAICAVRPILKAYVYSRTADKRDAFCRNASERLGIEVIAAQAPEEVPRAADILLTITTSATPVLLGKWITRPCLVVGVGSNHEFEREVDEELVTMANLIVVDDKAVAKVESGDLLWPISHGMLRWDQVKNLGDIVAGSVPVPDFSSGIFFFKSNGVAMEDVAIAARAYELARVQGIGTEISL